jgi:hypothetical protein
MERYWAGLKRNKTHLYGPRPEARISKVRSGNANHYKETFDDDQLQEGES